MKTKNIALIGASLALLLTSCSGGNKSSSIFNSSSSENPSSDTPSSVVSSATSQAKSSSKASSSSKVSSSKSSSSKSSSRTSSKDMTTFADITNPFQEGEKNYTIFDKVPEIRFTVTDTSKYPSQYQNDPLNFATKPGKSNKVDAFKAVGTISTTNCDDKFKLTSLAAEMKVRGNYTTDYQKKPFKITFTEDKQNMFGLRDGKKFEDWVLLADVKDSTLLRNAVMNYLAQSIMDQTVSFVPDFTPVRLYLNNQDWGMYLLVDQKKVEKNRVPVTKGAKEYEGTDIGYFFELDNYYTEEGPDGDPTFTVDYKPQSITWRNAGETNTQPIKGYTISSKIYGDAQIPFLKKRVEMTYEAIYRAVMMNELKEIQNEALVNTTETDIEKALGKIIDIDSFVNMYIVQEIGCDPDVGYSSFYLSLDMSESGNKKMTCTCPWDWDSAVGGKKQACENAQGLFVRNSSNMWMSILARSAFFMNKVKARWNDLKASGLLTKALYMIQDFSKVYNATYEQNFKKWPYTNEEAVGREIRSEITRLTTHEQTRCFLQNWLDMRFNALTTEFNKEFKEPVNYAQYKQGATKTIFEAEAAVLEGGATKKEKQSTAEEVISGNGYVGELDGKVGASMTFTVPFTKEAEVLLSARMSARRNDTYFGNMFTVEINGTELTEINNAVIPGVPNAANDYHNWTEVDVGMITLNQGNNTIKLTVKGVTSNFDCIYIYSK